MVDIARHSSQLDSPNLQLRNLHAKSRYRKFLKTVIKKFSNSNNYLFLKPYKSREISWQWRHVILFSGFWWCSPFPWTHLWWDVGEFRIADEGQSPLSKKALLQQNPIQSINVTKLTFSAFSITIWPTIFLARDPMVT